MSYSKKKQKTRFVRILVVGGGGREHAIAWSLLQSPNVEQVFCCPGNGGTAIMANCENIAVGVQDFPGIIAAAQQKQVEFVVVGPELPLSLGITDALQQAGIKVFGPVQAGAQIEASKDWAKQLMLDAGVPTAKSATFTEAIAAKNYINGQGAPIVVKADTLAAGKGVIVAMTQEEALAAVDELFGLGFEKLVVEEFLRGEEVSVLALTDGKTIIPLQPAQDHKRVGEGDTGKNTGGMGAYAPAPIATPEILARVEKEILHPTLKALQARGIDYRGVLYAGLMVSPTGEPKVLEFNCRFGDPETQAVLALLDTPLDELMLACIDGTLDQQEIKWKPGSAVCVVAASGGYPDAYARGKVVSGIDLAENDNTIVFHAGTKLVDNQIVTDGGRVLGITSVGKDFNDAIAKVYEAISQISFAGMYYRKDIGHRARQKI